VPVEEVERFGQQYVSLFALAKRRGRHVMVVKKELQHAGVEPVFNPRRSGRRSMRPQTWRREKLGKIEVIRCFRDTA
jgi:hypothetical protein